MDQGEWTAVPPRDDDRFVARGSNPLEELGPEPGLTRQPLRQLSRMLLAGQRLPRRDGNLPVAPGAGFY